MFTCSAVLVGSTSLPNFLTKSSLLSPFSVFSSSKSVPVVVFFFKSYTCWESSAPDPDALGVTATFGGFFLLVKFETLLGLPDTFFVELHLRGHCSRAPELAEDFKGLDFPFGSCCFVALVGFCFACPWLLSCTGMVDEDWSAIGVDIAAGRVVVTAQEFVNFPEPILEEEVTSLWPSQFTIVFAGFEWETAWLFFDGGPPVLEACHPVLRFTLSIHAACRPLAEVLSAADLEVGASNLASACLINFVCSSLSIFCLARTPSCIMQDAACLRLTGRSTFVPKRRNVIRFCLKLLDRLGCRRLLEVVEESLFEELPELGEPFLVEPSSPDRSDKCKTSVLRVPYVGTSLLPEVC